MAHPARHATSAIVSLACLMAPAGAQELCGDVQAAQKISETEGGVPLPLHGWGDGVATLGHLDGDGLLEIAVGEPIYSFHGGV